MMPAIDSFLATWSPRVLSILRIIVGLLFLEHGTSKYLSLPVSPSTGVYPPRCMRGEKQEDKECSECLLLLAS